MATYLSLTAPSDSTPPYARFTVAQFLGNLDLLYSAGLKWGICRETNIELDLT